MASESEDGRGTWSRSRAPVRAPLLPPTHCAVSIRTPHCWVRRARTGARAARPWWQHRWLASRGTAQEPRRGATGTLSPMLRYDPTDPQWASDPWPLYAELREAGRLQRSEQGSGS